MAVRGKKFNRFTTDGELLPEGHFEFEVYGEIPFNDGRKPTMIRMTVTAPNKARAIMTARKLFSRSVRFTVEKNLTKVVK
jgi:hypothetical protein